MKRLCLALIGLVALAGSAAAADLSRPAPVPYYPKAPVYVPYSWTGFYVGLNGGGAFGNSSWDSTGNRNISGGLVGGTIGYNYQWGRAVFGVEGDIDWADINGSTNNGCPLGCKTSDTWLSTVRGRLGYAADRFMPFVTGGAAFGDIRASTPGFAAASSTNAGWTLGGGLEGAITQNWTAKVEYLYVDLGKFNCGLNCGAGLVNDNVSFHTNILRAGVNYKFY
ncbi:MAG TPA: outer membrane protein [Xanthobacteraceae bacterium]|jgi:outer membrane immunogenic protein|nr:outer membrane protein [Xanthobacteraceae bacterium]